MALQPLSTLLPWPNINLGAITAGTISNGSTLDAAGEYVALVAQAREAMTISHFGFRANAVAGSPTADLRLKP